MSFIAEALQPYAGEIQDGSWGAKTKASFNNVSWADTPDFAKNAKKSSPAQLKGFRYEKRLEIYLTGLTKELGWTLISHRWVAYNGLFAQVDFILIPPSDPAILIEAKYTYTDTTEQRKLYTKLLEELGFISITSCTICHNLTPSTPRDKIIHTLSGLTQDSIWQLRI